MTAAYPSLTEAAGWWIALVICSTAVTLFLVGLTTTMDDYKEDPPSWWPLFIALWVALIAVSTFFVALMHHAAWADYRRSLG